MIAATRRLSALLLVVLPALVAPATAAIEPMANATVADHFTHDLYRWQRIDFPTSEVSRRNAAQIKVGIHTKGPSMQGLVRIPGAPAANFDTGMGLTLVDLINAGSEAQGYPDIVALEIVFKQAALGQFYQVFAIDPGPRD